MSPPGEPEGEPFPRDAERPQGERYVVPGKPEESYLLDLVTPAGEAGRPRMPREGQPLSPQQRDALRRWVAEGARWPDRVVLQERSKADPTWRSFPPLA